MVHPALAKEFSPSRIPHAIPNAAARRNADGLVAAYRYLCRRGARKYWRAGLERCDLEQVAAVGLIKASRRFDHGSNTPFEAYAWMSIVGELGHYVRDYERMIRTPRRLKALESRFAKARETCVGRLGREPLDAELALAMGVRESTVAEVRIATASAAVLSLEDAGAPTFAIATTLEPEDRMLVFDALRRLSETERRVIVGIYVLGLRQPELGRSLGLSARRVSRIRSAALRSMQRAWDPIV